MISQPARDAINAYNVEKKRIDAERELLDDRMHLIMDPLLNTSNLALFEELERLVYYRSYWSFELRRRIRALRKLTSDERKSYERQI